MSGIGMNDPTREEMLDALADEIAALEADEFDVEDAIYWFANDWHSGQWSNLYSALSTSEFCPSPLARGPDGDTADHLYNALVEAFGIPPQE